MKTDSLWLILSFPPHHHLPDPPPQVHRLQSVCRPRLSHPRPPHPQPGQGGQRRQEGQGEHSGIIILLNLGLFVSIFDHVSVSFIYSCSLSLTSLPLSLSPPTSNHLCCGNLSPLSISNITECRKSMRFSYKLVKTFCFALPTPSVSLPPFPSLTWFSAGAPSLHP